MIAFNDVLWNLNFEENGLIEKVYQGASARMINFKMHFLYQYAENQPLIWGFSDIFKLIYRNEKA